MFQLEMFVLFFYQDAEKKAEEERIRMENIVRGNPLINGEGKSSDFKVKRRYGKCNATLLDNTFRCKCHVCCEMNFN